MSKLTDDVREIVEYELRRGTTHSRIAHILDLKYEDAQKVIQAVQEAVCPNVGDRIRFTFRDQPMKGTIQKLLTNSAVVLIDWDYSSLKMQDLCEDRTIVNFKDIKEFIPNK